MSDITKAIFQFGNTVCRMIGLFWRYLTAKMPVNGLFWVMAAWLKAIFCWTPNKIGVITLSH
ncbi:hypothetical protein [Serratia liquefaciens]|uniref:hypothetical protein n=1 Tax=Serratia liquefaciens TaxID=614 RepID=UPI0021B847E6|nr:hypothetical protein [Serratia liquefaciens]HEJ7995691.1 hypothetical protein [Serratia liquefaciens]